jgi:hypothetical protein
MKETKRRFRRSIDVIIDNHQHVCYVSSELTPKNGINMNSVFQCVDDEEMTTSIEGNDG